MADLAVQDGESRDSYGLRIATSLLREATDSGGRRTCIYFIEDGEAIKVGVADDPHARLASLQTGNSGRLHLRGFYPGPSSLERVIHRAFAEDRLQGEWFVATEALEILCDTLYGAAIGNGLVVTEMS